MNKKGRINLTIAILLLLFLPIFVFKEYRNLKFSRIYKEVAGEEVAFTQGEDKSFVILDFSDENTPFSVSNLQSIVNQHYPHFRVIFISIGMPTAGAAVAKEYCLKYNPLLPVSSVQFTTREEFYEHFAAMIQNCKDDEVVVHIEGNDWLASPDALLTLNQAYQDPDVWLTYGESIDGLGSGKRETKHTHARSVKPWMTATFKTYYAGLFKQMSFAEVKGAHLFDPNSLMPIVEVAKWHIRFIPDVLYVHSQSSGHGEVLAQ